MSGSVTSLPETWQSELFGSFNKILTQNIEPNQYRKVLQEYKINTWLMALSVWCKVKKKTHMHKTSVQLRLKFTA